MKFLLRKQTKETKTRQKRFFAFMLSVLICCLPTATVLAENLNFYRNPGTIQNSTINSDETIMGSGHVTFTYLSPDGTDITPMPPNAIKERNFTLDDTQYLVPTIAGYNKWLVTVFTEAPGTNNYVMTLKAIEEKPAQPVKEEKSEDTSESKHDDQTPASWEANPNEISAFYINNGFIDNRVKLGKEEQGETCQFIFRSSFPAGNNYKEAFSLSMSYDGKHTTDLKDGTLLLYIPPNLQRSGRKFKMLAINKDGEVFLFDNTSDNEGIFQTKLYVEGYAFCLIYTDEFILN